MDRRQLVSNAVVAAAVLLAVLFLRGSLALIASMMLAMAAVVFLPWSLYSLVRMVIRPAERPIRAAKMGIWLVAIALSVAVHAFRDAGAREKADAVARAVQLHKARSGAYPDNLAAVGQDAQALRSEMHMAYRVEDGKAFLFYSQPSMPTVAHHYDFEAGRWDHRD